MSHNLFRNKNNKDASMTKKSRKTHNMPTQVQMETLLIGSEPAQFKKILNRHIKNRKI